MAALYNDGTVQYGSRSWAIKQSNGSTDRGTYVTDNITINRPVKRILRTNQLGEPTGSVGVADFVTGTATLQLADGSATEPISSDLIKCDAVVNAVLDSAVGSETFFISGVDRAETKDGEIKLTISFIKKYGA